MSADETVRAEVDRTVDRSGTHTVPGERRAAPPSRKASHTKRPSGNMRPAVAWRRKVTHRPSRRRNTVKHCSGTPDPDRLEQAPQRIATDDRYLAMRRSGASTPVASNSGVFDTGVFSLLRGKRVERLACRLQDRRSTGFSLPALDDDVAVARVELDEPRGATGALRRDQGRAAAAETDRAPPRRAGSSCGSPAPRGRPASLWDAGRCGSAGR